MAKCNFCGGDKLASRYRACPDCRAAWRVSARTFDDMAEKAVLAGEALRYLLDRPPTRQRAGEVAQAFLLLTEAEAALNGRNLTDVTLATKGVRQEMSDHLSLFLADRSRRYSVNPACGDVFREDDDYDGLTLTIEVLDEAEADAILRAMKAMLPHWRTESVVRDESGVHDG